MSEKSAASKITGPLTIPKRNQDYEIVILDTTLRDGSYAIDFKFTLDDTRRIAMELESSGVKQIEIGHGWGLNAESAGFERAAHSDLEYIKAAGDVLTVGKFGCFFIPGVARAGDLIMARDLGMDFIRIGNNITEYTKQKDYIRIAKNLGFHVSSNLLKTYVVEPEEFGLRARQVAEMGADVVVCVDSAGGMTPGEVRRYIRAAKRKTRVVLGFHGHDNLGLANANALAAVEEGATVIDSTLQGIGRSAGNAITESLVLLLEASGFKTGLDPYRLMDAGERLIRPYLIANGGFDATDFVLGVARFHSSFVPLIKEIAKQYGVDFRHLIMEAAKVDRTKVDYDVVLDLAKNMTGKHVEPGFTSEPEKLKVSGKFA